MSLLLFTVGSIELESDWHRPLAVGTRFEVDQSSSLAPLLLIPILESAHHVFDLVFGQQNTSVQCHVVRKRIGISGHVIVGVRLNKSTAIVNIIFMHHVIILPMGLSFVYLLFSVPRSLLNNMWPGF